MKEQYRIWEEEARQWQREQEKERDRIRREKEEQERIRKEKIWRDYEEKEGARVVNCPNCNGWGELFSKSGGFPPRPCNTCHSRGKLDPRNSEDKKQLLWFLDCYGYEELKRRQRRW